MIAQNAHKNRRGVLTVPIVRLFGNMPGTFSQAQRNAFLGRLMPYAHLISAMFGMIGIFFLIVVPGQLHHLTAWREAPKKWFASPITLLLKKNLSIRKKVVY